jgi:hypothetical protein
MTGTTILSHQTHQVTLARNCRFCRAGSPEQRHQGKQYGRASHGSEASPLTPAAALIIVNESPSRQRRLLFGLDDLRRLGENIGGPKAADE